MKIGGLGSVKSAGSTKKRRAVSSVSSFADLLGISSASETGGVGGADQVAATTTVSNLLAAQEVSADAHHRNAVIREGEFTLDTLEKLRRQLLSGAVPLNTLAEIKGRIKRQKQNILDPHLRQIMDEIELRASVELAKLEVALANQEAARSEYKP